MLAQHQFVKASFNALSFKSDTRQEVIATLVQEVSDLKKGEVMMKANLLLTAEPYALDLMIHLL